MSILKVLQLVCDADGCMVAYEAEFRDLSTAVEQRRKAKTLGWTQSGGRDLCPDHAPQPKAQRS